MPITNENAVLILGAGASAPMGMPLGGQLMNNISQELRGRYPSFRREWAHSIFEFPNKFNPDLERRFLPLLAIGSTFKSGEEITGKMIVDRASKIADLLEQQTSETIDDFISMNPIVASMTKALIASAFFSELYERGNEPGNRYKIKALENRHLGGGPKNDDKKDFRRNWVHLLINVVRHGMMTGTVSADNPVRIISFNYDGIVEFILNEQFGNVSDKNRFGRWQDIVKISHPHGYMGNLERVVDNPVRTISRWAQTIEVVNNQEIEKGHPVRAARAIARKWIDKAEDVYAAGFAFSKPNCNLLGLATPENTNRTIHALNFDGSPGFKRKVEQMENFAKEANSPFSLHTEIMSGTPSAPLHIDEWFQYEIPGDLPG